MVDLHFPDPFNPPAAEQPELLGTANDGVPAELHQEMQRLAQAGVIPITTPDQRARNRGSGGTEYGVPAAFADARRFSYVHPNLPPPTGYHWRCRGSEWTLCVKGGGKLCQPLSRGLASGQVGTSTNLAVAHVCRCSSQSLPKAGGFGVFG